MKKFIFLLFFALFSFHINAFAASDTDSYYPEYDNNKYKAGRFWGSFIFNGYLPIGKSADNLGISSGVGFGVNFLDFVGIELRGAYQSYAKTSNILAYSGLIPNDGIKGLENINKFDITGYLILQPAFKVKSNLYIIPYVAAGANFSIIQYSFVRDLPAFSYAANITSLGFAAKAGVKFRFNYLLLGVGVEYIMTQPSASFNVDFSSLTYGLEIGFIL